MNRIKVGILGATGMAGQRYLELLKDHPFFEVCYLAASPRSAGKKYKDAVRLTVDFEYSLAEDFENIIVRNVNEVEEAKACQLVFSALDSSIAKEVEPQYAAAGKIVISNASAFRNEPDVPVVIPEINSHHLQIIELQKAKRGWSGFIVTKPNCSIQSYLLPTYLLHRYFPVAEMVVQTMQAISGAGYPGLSAMQIMGNVVPYIDGEEQKSEQEPLKILGSVEMDGIKKFSIS